VLLILCLGTGLVHAATTINISSFANQTCALILATAPPFPSASKPYNGIPFLIPGTRMGRRTTFGG